MPATAGPGTGEPSVALYRFVAARTLDIVHSVDEYLYEGAADYLAELDHHAPGDELDYEP